MTTFDEHTSFAKLTTSLEEAEAAAKMIGVHRSDRRWDSIASLIKRIKEQVYDVAAASTVIRR